MVRIYDLVQTVLATGYLTIAIEEQLRSLLKASQYEPEDLVAFTKLQQFVMAGSVKQESREHRRVQQHPSDCVDSQSVTYSMPTRGDMNDEIL